MSKKVSLRQFLMGTGKFDKAHDCLNAVRSGRISINGKIIANPNYFFNPKRCFVRFENKNLNQIKKFYFILNKPSGYICQKSRNEKTIYNLIEKLKMPKESKSSLFAVGRLDKDTEGLIVLTNDGKLSNYLANPETEIKKQYYAKLEKAVDADEIKKLENGIEIDICHEKYKTKPSRIKIIYEREINITIYEGKKRQIRKMFEAINNKVVYLKRTAIGNLKLGNLKNGEIREVSKEEIF